MSSKKYQIFVSSTFSDLKEERNVVSKSVLDLGHVPAGMELFPAADIEQLTYIKKVIDECDYYLLVVGGRYGSINTDGISYTELEYDYAVQSGIPVLAFIHSNPSDIPVGKSDTDQGLSAKLSAFREKITTGRLVQFWESKDALQAKAIISLTKAFSETPRVGWVRADLVSSIEMREELVRIKDENEQLRAKVTRLSSTQKKLTNLAGLDTIYKIRYQEKYRIYDRTNFRATERDFTLREVFIAVGRDFYTAQSLYQFGISLGTYIKDSGISALDSSSFNKLDLEGVAVQLVGLDLMRMFVSPTVQGGQSVFYQLTASGQQFWLENRVRRQVSLPSPNALP